ncbi:MAG: leucine--tRNA ligase [Planctomycetes bacterium]|jgi:leucyl-tRNA synthetase|nr:leucine--tRNA ligase [Planctomycetota bacterium]
MKYKFTEIERKWQQRWAADQTFKTPNPRDPGFDAARPKFYVLDMFPYPSGVGLHVGHPLGYIATDIVARFQRMRGYHVLHPMGFDAFGLPAEQYAVETGTHPRVTTEQNIDNMVRQLKRLGLGYDWDRQIATTDVGYYKWTQWVFLQLYHSYFDPIEQAARPIAELERKLRGEDYYVGIDAELIYSGLTEDLEALGGIGDPGAHKWHELDADQQRRLLDEYRLAYMDEVEVNWCPGLGTVLANEEVTNDGRSERGNYPVYQRPLRQWMLRITAYAQRLIDDLDRVDWPESVKLLQRNWVGKSTGAQVDFAVDGVFQEGETPIITVFTTRPDTLFGATYMVLAPEHELVSQITTAEHRAEVETYVKQAKAKTAVDRQAEAKEKTGVFTGAHAINPVNGQSIPIWIADYVMMGYGTGAIMAVPAHDERDFEFAEKFDLPIIPVVKPNTEPGSEEDASDQPRAFTGQGVNLNSANDEVSLDGLPTAEAKKKITDWLERKGLGRAKVQYKLRDWLFSRQRYWGEPFPILHELDASGEPTGVVRAVDEGDLPVQHPPLEDFRPTASEDPDAPPQPPLGRADDDWKFVELDGKRYRRELNTMPQWAGSCWYYLRYLDPHNEQQFVEPSVERYWMTPGSLAAQTATAEVDPSAASPGAGQARGLSPAASGGVDLYVGGVEHAVLHLLYARFWHKVLYDLGHVSTPEPFGRLFNQGYIQAYYFEKPNGVRVPADEVEQRDGKYFFEGEEVKRLYGKMGKSLKNAVTPDDVCDQYGCDTLRLYEMYMGPLNQSKVWNPQDIVGVHRFLQRLWRNLIDEETGKLRVAEAPPSEELARATHKTIKRVTEAMDALSLNVAIAALIELNNKLVSLDATPRWVAEQLVTMLAPLAPHISEELWERLGYEGGIADVPWPTWDQQMLVEDTIELPVQVNGKLRGKISVPADADDAAVEEAAKADENVATHLEGKTVRKVIVIKGKLINIVVG